MIKRPFLYANYEDIKSGKTTDIYFIRTMRILDEEKLSNTEVYMELTVSSMPENYNWAILGGLRDVANLLKGLPISVDAIPEGTVFYKKDFYGIKEPIMTITGPYGKFALYETPILGFLAMGSGIATKAARIRKIAGRNTLIISFGARRTHPAISPFNSFYAYIGGCNGVSCILGAEFLGKNPVGTMPHSLIIIFKNIRGSEEEAWKAFDRIMPKNVPRIFLTDTYTDEVDESLRAVISIGKEKTWGVRLDTPSSRRGSFTDIVREVKWKLKANGFENVKIFVSGGIDEDSILGLIEAGASGFGIGSAIASAKIIDIAMDITSIKKDGKWIPTAKRGKFSGRKKVYRCMKCMIDVVRLEDETRPRCPKCGGKMEELLKPLIRNGRIVMEFPSPDEEREYVLNQLEKISL